MNKRVPLDLDDERTAKLNGLLSELFHAPENYDVRGFTQKHWFRSLPMWLEMQKEIFAHNELMQQRREAGENLGHHRLPTTNNFQAVPLCGFKRQHIRIDHECLLYIIRKYKWFKCTPTEFHEHKSYFWNEVYEMRKIQKMMKKKEFAGQIVSDGVGVSILFKRSASYRPGFNK